MLQKKGYGPAVDWWSLGVIVFESLLGYPPFWGETPIDTCRKILHHQRALKFPPERMKGVSQTAVAFVRALVCDEKDRLKTAEEVRAHPWFAGVDWATLERSGAAGSTAGAAAGGAGSGAADAEAAPGPFASFVPPRLAAALAEIEALPRDAARGDASLDRLVKEATACFDNIDQLPPSDPRAQLAGDAAAAAHRERGGGAHYFAGYTWKRPEPPSAAASALAVPASAAAPAGGSPTAVAVTVAGTAAAAADGAEA